MPYVNGAFVVADQEWNNRDCGCGAGPTGCCGSRACPSCHPGEGYDSGWATPSARRTRPVTVAGFGEYRDSYGNFRLLGYGHKPRPLWKGGDGTEPGLPYYGMEIEISCSSTETMKWAAENFGTDLVYLKADGSVRGFEMVTHPMTFPWALENFPWPNLVTLKDKGCTISPSSNGIHVHVSRTGFGDGKHGDAHQLRWFKLIYRNAGEVERIARRRSGEWAGFSATHQRGQFAHLKARNGTMDADNRRISEKIMVLQRAKQELRTELDRKYAGRYGLGYSLSADSRDQETKFTYELRARARDMDAQIQKLSRSMLQDTTGARYSAINTLNRHTYEMRVFASTLDPVTAQSTIGLVSATVEYTRKLTAHDIVTKDALGWDAFATWLEGQPLYAAVRYANDKCTASSGSGRASI